ncbi:accessory gland protein Acp29AB-like [Drosophila biarmipes]|uniref:accessory gland protein Acp29AB-like n=1 Tax=Drosophila biarmipes TaxID=125945 RepID=UPI0007E6CB3D|nr:accessory gland protein Acp29AB-like [Drosophila biarmipes]
MFKLAILLYVIITGNRYSSLADHAPSMCLLQDPPNQCGEFCLTALKPLIDHIANHQELWNSRDAFKLNETQTNLARIKEQLEAVQGTLKDISAADFKGRLTQIEDHQTALESQLKSVQIKMEAQQTALLESLSKVNKKSIPPNFKRMGSRFFDIESNLKLDWKSAEDSCRQVGGHLAIIQSGEEFAAINANLDRTSIYWLGITEHANRTDFVSLNSDQLAPFLKWQPGEPKYIDKSSHCVVIYKGQMWVDPCKQKALFICQADDVI